jgi:hypothetical protein
VDNELGIGPGSYKSHFGELGVDVSSRTDQTRAPPRFGA